MTAVHFYAKTENGTRVRGFSFVIDLDASTFLLSSFGGKSICLQASTREACLCANHWVKPQHSFDYRYSPVLRETCLSVNKRSFLVAQAPQCFFSRGTLFFCCTRLSTRISGSPSFT